MSEEQLKAELNLWRSRTMALIYALPPDVTCAQVLQSTELLAQHEARIWNEAIDAVLAAISPSRGGADWEVATITNLKKEIKQ